MSKKQEIPRLTTDGDQVTIYLDCGHVVGGEVIGETGECIEIKTPAGYSVRLFGAHITALWALSPEQARKASQEAIANPQGKVQLNVRPTP